VRGRDTDKAALDGIGQNFAVLRQYMVGADVRQDFGQDVTKFDITEVAFLHSFTTDTVGRVTQQVRLYVPHNNCHNNLHLLPIIINNSNTWDNAYGAVIMTQSYFENSPSSSEECRPVSDG